MVWYVRLLWPGYVSDIWSSSDSLNRRLMTPQQHTFVAFFVAILCIESPLYSLISFVFNFLAAPQGMWWILVPQLGVEPMAPGWKLDWRSYFLNFSCKIQPKQCLIHDPSGLAKCPLFLYFFASSIAAENFLFSFTLLQGWGWAPQIHWRISLPDINFIFPHHPFHTFFAACLVFFFNLCAYIKIFWGLMCYDTLQSNPFVRPFLVLSVRIEFTRAS